ncbi:porin [Labrys okinawensis]|uniref:porin n=1 Tax=Labrys okinawensis TaxID=346911 RepID=UPI0039BC5DCE
MSIKSYFLAVVASFAGAGAAAAADLPEMKSQAVEYVKVCSQFGPGFFYLPGSNTCLQIAGTMRALYGFNSIPGGSYSTTPGFVPGRGGGRRDVDSTAFQGRFQLDFDARTQTDYGVLRSYFSIDANFGHPGPQTRPFGSYSGSNYVVEKAYVEFGGLTAGYAESRFAFYDNYYADTIFAPYAGSGQDGTTGVLAYTAQFGNSGWSATLSLEDPAHARQGILNDNPVGVADVAYGGNRYPDIIGDIAYSSGKFDKIQIMAAAHQLWLVGGNPNSSDRSKWGYAVGAGASWEIPVLAGGYFAIEGAYSSGASIYTGAAMNLNATAGSPPNYDGFSVDGRVENAKAVSVEGELAINFTPNLRGMIFGSYAHFDAPTAVEVDGVGSGFDAYVVGANMKWTVVEGFDVIPEVSYQATHAKVAGFNEIGGEGLYNNSKADTGAVMGGVEFRRSF